MSQDKPMERLEVPKLTPRPEGAKPGDPEWMAWMSKRRKETSRMGGVRRYREPEVTRAEAREKKLTELYPKALLVLEKAIDRYLEEGLDADKAVKAAMRVADQVEGKAAQTIKQETQVEVIRYESAAWRPIPGLEVTRMNELPAADLEGEVVEEAEYADA